MKKTAIVLSIILIILSLCSCAPSNTIDAYAKDFIISSSKGNYEQATKHFDDTMKSKMTPDKVKDLWEYCVTQYGPFSKIISTVASKKEQYDIISVNCLFEKGSITINVVFNSDKKISGINSDFVLYSDSPQPPNGVKEADIKIGEGTQWELGGTLSYFQDKTEGIPAVIFVGGSGPQTRNETVGSQSLFRDLAWGLSSRGIAVLRYDKRTYTHSEKLAQEYSETITLKEEYTDDIIQAVKALKSQNNVKVSKIYILGHSLGASILPRISKEVPDAAGYIFMAANARPLEDLILDQYTYLYSIDETSTQAQKEEALNKIKATVDVIKNLNVESTNKASELFGTPKSYWLDLKGYAPAKAAKEISKPMLFLQGEKDYQVTMTDFNMFKQEVGSKFNVNFISYPDLNHMFTKSEGEKSTPADYNNNLNADQKVINDIYEFVK